MKVRIESWGAREDKKWKWNLWDRWCTKNNMCLITDHTKHQRSGDSDIGVLLLNTWASRQWSLLLCKYALKSFINYHAKQWTVVQKNFVHQCILVTVLTPWAYTGACLYACDAFHETAPTHPLLNEAFSLLYGTQKNSNEQLISFFCRNCHHAIQWISHQFDFFQLAKGFCSVFSFCPAPESSCHACILNQKSY